MFPGREKPDCTGRPGSPLELLILGALRVLGRALVFDDLEEGTRISAEVHRTFFHEFIEYYSIYVYPQVVKIPNPEIPEELEKLERMIKPYEMAGFPGCIGSVDGTHFRWDVCPSSLTVACQGKEGFPTIGIQVSVTHWREIIHTTTTFNGTINDLTKTRYDDFIMGLHEGRILQNHTFELFKENGTPVKHKGLYVLADNGYHKWKCLQNPPRDAFTPMRILYSETLESLRKDVECTFGILKGRWRILKTGFRFPKQETLFHIIRTCSALHNQLLSLDGLDKGWCDVAQEAVAPSHKESVWLSTWGKFDESDINIFEKHSISVIANPRENDAFCNHQQIVRDTDAVSETNHRTFQQALIANFSYRALQPYSHQHSIKWPKRGGAVSYNKGPVVDRVKILIEQAQGQLAQERRALEESQ